MNAWPTPLLFKAGAHRTNAYTAHSGTLITHVISRQRNLEHRSGPFHSADVTKKLGEQELTGGEAIRTSVF